MAPPVSRVRGGDCRGGRGTTLEGTRSTPPCPLGFHGNQQRNQCRGADSSQKLHVIQFLFHYVNIKMCW